MPDWSTRVLQEGRSLGRLLTICLILASKEPALLPDALALVARIRRLHLSEAGGLGHLRRVAAQARTPEPELRRLRALHHQFEPEAEGALRRVLDGARRHDVRIDVETMETAEVLLEDRTTIRETLFGMLGAPAAIRIDAAGMAADARFVLDALEPLLPRYTEAELRLRAAPGAQGLAAPDPVPISAASNGVV